MGLFTIKGRSDSSHYPPFSNSQSKEKKRDEVLVVKEDEKSATEVKISSSLRSKIKKDQINRKKLEEGISVLQLAEEGLKNISSLLLKEKDLDKLRVKIDEICENSKFGGKKVLDNKEGHQEFLKYFTDFQIEAQGECKFVPNLSSSCLKLEEGIDKTLEYIKKQEKLIMDKKEILIKELSGDQILIEVSALLKKTSSELSRNQDLSIHSQVDFFTQDLLKII